MGFKTQYKGYKSFQYLEPEYDYKPFELAKDVGRVEEYLIPLESAEEERVKQLVKDFIFISLHDHPTISPADLTNIFEYHREGREWTAYEGLSHS